MAGLGHKSGVLLAGLKLPEIQNMIRRDKMAMSICEQFMPS